jgi:hypothetical protein
MRKVALRESPGIHLKIQSDLTFARGNLFEKSVLANDAARLVRELKRLDIGGGGTGASDALGRRPGLR